MVQAAAKGHRSGSELNLPKVRYIGPDGEGIFLSL